MLWLGECCLPWERRNLPGKVNAISSWKGVHPGKCLPGGVNKFTWGRVEKLRKFTWGSVYPGGVYLAAFTLGEFYLGTEISTGKSVHPGEVFTWGSE